MSAETPDGVLRDRLGARTEALAAAVARSDLLGNLRLFLVAVALLLLILPLFVRNGGPWWLLIPLAAGFVFLGKAQDVAFDRRRRLEAAVAFYRDAVARLEERWRTLPDDGEDLGRHWKPDRHFAEDLDLFGPASLFQLLNRAVTAGGRRTLAAWLVNPAEADEVRARQDAVRELAGDLDFRESLVTAAAGNAPGVVEDERLLDWAEGRYEVPRAGVLRILGIVQPLGLAATGLPLLFVEFPKLPFAIAILLHAITLAVTQRFTGQRAALLSGPDLVLTRYARLIEAAEGASFTADGLKALQARLRQSGRPASDEIRGLHRFVDLLDARLNMFFALSLGPALLWDLNLVLRAEGWRARTGPKLRGWLTAIADLEALASLAALAHERPDYVFPELLEGAPTFRSDGLTHPLIDRTRVQSNDFALEGPGQVVLLSGSNMSGKSTLLRSVGLSVIMARAGAPVAASALATSPFRLCTSVRIVDSLASGTSHFYAELKRLKLIVDEARDTSGDVLYLLDEVLHGTNSRERYIGAVSVIKWLSEQGALGIVTTHDLALARLESELSAERVRNFHFSDDVAEGKIHFDYKLRPGPVRSTNALRLMRAVGIDVDFVEPAPEA